VIAAALVAACVEPGPSAPAAATTPPANRTWRGERPWHFLGSLVDARDSTLTDAPLLFGENPVEQWDLVNWRVDASAPSGPVSAIAAGRIEGMSDQIRFADDLDGSGSPEVVGRVLAPDNGWVLFDAAAVGTMRPRDAWSRSPPLSGPGVVRPRGDINGDGTKDLCAEGFGLLHAWFAPLDPETFSATEPDMNAPLPSDIEGGSLFGLAGSDGPVVVATWRRTFADNETYLTVLGPDFDLATGVSTSGLPEFIVSGDFATLAGDEAFLWGGGTHLGDVTLYGVVEGAMQPTGCTITTDDAALYTNTTGAAGDFDGDGALDLALSALGSVFVFLGPFSPELLTLEDAALRVRSGVEDDDFAQSLAAADVDGDGRSDLVVGAPGDDRLARDAGAVYLWRGVDLFP
jgi:hypothetical protein